jgi:hypothetical protein
MALEIAGQLLGEGGARDQIEAFQPVQQAAIGQIAGGIVAPRLDEGGDLQPRACTSSASSGTL